MLEINGICKVFNPGTVNEKQALRGVDLHLKPGAFVTVIGGNGAGKSTLLNSIAGVYPVDQGSIKIGGVDVTHLPEYRRAKYIGRVFQDPMMGTAATMQIEENMALAARRGKFRSLMPGITNKEREFYREQLKILGLGLEDRMKMKVGLLSGGQRQYGQKLRVNFHFFMESLLADKTGQAIALGFYQNNTQSFIHRRQHNDILLKRDCYSDRNEPLLQQY